MRNYRISYTSLQQCNGINLPLLLIDGVPEPLAAAYALNKFVKGDELNTIDAQLRQILILLRFLDNEKDDHGKPLDFHERMSGLEGFSNREIIQFSIYCTNNFREESNVMGSTYKLRINYAWRYIDHWFNFYQRRAQNNPARFNQATEVKRLMALSFENVAKVPGLGGVKKQGLQPDLKEKFFAIIDPNSEINPWKQERTRWRNYVLFLIYILSGNRRGEQLLLEVTDFVLDGPNPSFVIKHRNRPTYPRKIAPAIKTRGRSIALGPELCDILKFYLITIRPKFANANKSSYMFLSGRDGGPLAINTVNTILDTLKQAHPEFQFVLSPHRLRNTLHDMLEEQLRKSPLSTSPLLNQAKKQEIQTYAGGWSPTSNEPHKYTEGERERATNRAQKEIQRDNIESINA